MRIDKDAYKRTVGEIMEQMKSQEMYRRFVSLAGTSHLSARNLAAVLYYAPKVKTLIGRRQLKKPFMLRE